MGPAGLHPVRGRVTAAAGTPTVTPVTGGHWHRRARGEPGAGHRRVGGGSVVVIGPTPLSGRLQPLEPGPSEQPWQEMGIRLALVPRPRNRGCSTLAKH
eukprot:759911-Hanusia_phi.AAC.13